MHTLFLDYHNSLSIAVASSPILKPTALQLMSDLPTTIHTTVVLMTPKLNRVYSITYFSGITIYTKSPDFWIISIVLGDDVELY